MLVGSAVLIRHIIDVISERQNSIEDTVPCFCIFLRENHIKAFFRNFSSRAARCRNRILSQNHMMRSRGNARLNAEWPA